MAGGAFARRAVPDGFDFHKNTYFMGGCKTGHQNAPLLRARAIQTPAGLRRANKRSPDPMNCFAYVSSSSKQEQLARREEMEMVGGCDKGGNFAMAASEVRQSPAAVTAEVTREQTFIPAKAEFQLLLQSSKGVSLGFPHQLLYPDLRFVGV